MADDDTVLPMIDRKLSFDTFRRLNAKRLLLPCWCCPRRRFCGRIRFQTFEAGIISQVPIMGIGVTQIILGWFRPGNNIRYRVEIRCGAGDERGDEDQNRDLSNPGPRKGQPVSAVPSLLRLLFCLPDEMQSTKRSV